ncbi:MAG: hypothetical protein NE330_22435, partial [Lentisphaeraceae bacterium]|nr:hypothetical protein [Lentisphaeraceae bacterium]
MMNFSSIPTPLKVGGGIVAVAGAGSLFFLKNKLLLTYFLIGVVGVLVLVAFIFFVLYLMKKAKEKKREKELTTVDPAQKTDEVVAKFEEGINKFKKNGKNLYSIPWYAFIGAPGSGKTWAIRNSGIVFPPEFSGAVKGHSGTKGMDWWLSDDAVLLDTAGEMTVQEDLNSKIVSDKMWSTFLDKLKKFRPREPINGIFLAIPAESLLVDSVEEIDQKAGQILSRLKSLQEHLQVRFPLYIIITKCDKICGFREFWESLDEVPDFKLKEKLQGQMLGWCNSGKLDAPFQIDSVYESLNGLVKRLKSYRLGLLRPSKDKDIQAKTAALYSFPDNLGKVTQKLELYLQRILPTSPTSWDKDNNKSLFVRGLYFTSAMQEGSVFDNAVAELTGLSLDEISPSTERKENKYYFLRDLFLKKAFDEQGLVTSANNAQQQNKKRKVVILSAALVSICALIGLSIYSSQTLKKNIGNHNDVWASANDELNWEDGNWRPLVHKQNSKIVFDERKPVEFEGKKYETVEFLELLKDYSTKPINIPLIFRALTISDTSNEVIEQSMKDSLAKLYTYSAIKPVVETVEAGFVESNDWSELKSKTLIEIIKLRTVPNEIYGQEKVTFLDLKDFYKLALPQAKLADYEKYSEAVNSFLTSENWSDATYPPRELQLEDFNIETNQNLKKGLELFANSLANLDEVKELKSTVRVLTDLKDEFETFESFTSLKPLDKLAALLADWQKFEKDKLFDNEDVLLVNTLDKYADLEDLLKSYESKRELVLKSIAEIEKAENSIRSGYETVNTSLSKILSKEEFKESANLIEAYRTALKVTEVKLNKYAQEIVYIKSEKPENEKRVTLKSRISSLISSKIKSALEQNIDLGEIEDNYGDLELKYKLFKDTREKRVATFDEVEDRFEVFYQHILAVNSIKPKLASWKDARQQLLDLIKKAETTRVAFNTKAVEDKAKYELPAKVYTSIFDNAVKNKILFLTEEVAVNDKLNAFNELIVESEAPRAGRLNKVSSEKFPLQYRPEVLGKVYDDWSSYFDFIEKQKEYILDENAFLDNKTKSLDKLKEYFETYATYWTENVYDVIEENS